MPIKQIQLRGISRDPSDRMTEDGGLAESLNVHLEQRETAPTLPPSDRSRDYARQPWTFSGPPLFIHNGSGYENLLFLDTAQNKLMYYSRITRANTAVTTPHEVMSLLEGETVKDISSIGNTIVVLTDKRMEYVLYKDSAYRDKGDMIPVPHVEFRCMDVTAQYYFFDEEGALGSFQNHPYEKARGRVELLNGAFTPRDEAGSVVYKSRASISRGKWTPAEMEDYSLDQEYLEKWDNIEWQKFFDGASLNSEAYVGVKAKIWDLVETQVVHAKRLGAFGAPVFARYALRLYDGSYIYQSVPVLLGGSVDKFFKATARRSRGYTSEDSNQLSNSWQSYLITELTNMFIAKAFLSEVSYDDWEDIVESVDLFISTDIRIPMTSSDITALNLEENTDTLVTWDISFSEKDSDLESERRLAEVLSKSNFYKVASFKVGELEKLKEGYNLLSRKELASQDYLVTQDELPDGYLSDYQKRPGALFRYNNRLIITDITQTISTGYPFLNGQMLDASQEAERKSYDYEFRFYLRINGKEQVVSSKTVEGGYVFSGDAEFLAYYGYQRVTNTPARLGARTLHAAPYAWLAYPDPRCYKVEFKIITYDEDGTAASTKYGSYKMEPHPSLNCSYAFCGLGVMVGFDKVGSLVTTWSRHEAGTFRETNVVWASLMNNPFVFQASGRHTFYSDVISVATITMPLSEGQFGQFDIYVFTADGIWTIPITASGDFAKILPVTRDVAISKGGILSLESAIVFATEQGVMLLDGRTVENISPNMNGRHFILEGETAELLENSPWKELAAIEDDNDPFMAFVKNASVGYDYAGARLIFFNDDKPYQYVYYLRTGTWHKYLSSQAEYKVLNSYPECLVGVTEDGSNYMLYDYSTVLDSTDVLTDTANPVKGLIITRPFDLGESDIRKTITDIRIRGQFNRSDVKYILLGSMDGITWKRLRSLRGGSFKLFRLLLLCNLSPTERISWIDVEYETRFTNRLR